MHILIYYYLKLYAYKKSFHFYINSLLDLIKIIRVYRFVWIFIEIFEEQNNNL